MKKRLIALLLSITLVTALATGCGNKDKETEVTERVETVEDAEVEEITPTAEPTVEPTEAPTPTEAPAPTETPTPEPTVEPTTTPTPEPTATPVPTEAPTPTVAPTEAVAEAVPTEVVIMETPVPTAAPTSEPTPVPVVATRQVGADTMFVWSYTANGTPIYDSVNATNPGYPQYMIDALSNSGVTPEMSDYDKAVTLARYLAKRISYDYESNYGVTTYRTLHTNKAVCQGYANTYSQLMHMLGIECYYESGYATTDAGITGAHGWNRVVINGISYYNDITWNSCLGNELYLMIDYNTISKNHNIHAEYFTRYDTIWTDERTITF